MKNDDLEHFDEELFDSLDEAGRHAVAAVFLSTPSIPKDSAIRRELVRRGYASPDGEA